MTQDKKDKQQEDFKLLSELELKKRLKKKRKFLIHKPFRMPFSLDIFRYFLPLSVIFIFLLMIFYGRGAETKIFLMSPFLLVPIKLTKLLFKTEGFFLAFLIISFFLAITPAVIALFQYLVTKSWQISFFSSLIFCFIICYCLLINKIETPGSLLQFAEGEHIAALPFLLISSLLFWQFLRKGTVRKLLGASISIGFLTLFSKTAFLAFLVFLAIFSLSEFFLRSTKTTVKRVVLSFICAGGLMAFWYNPHFMMGILRLSFQFGFWEKAWSLFPLALWLVPITGVIVFLLFNQVPARQPLFINLGIFIVPSLSLLFWYNFDFFLWPLAGRFIWEFLIGASLFGGFLLEILSTRLGNFFREKFDIKRWQLILIVDLARLVFIVFWTLLSASLFSKFYEENLLQLESWNWVEEGVWSFIGLKYFKQMILGFVITFLTLWMIYKNKEKAVE